jgi:hypothetical protein
MLVALAIWMMSKFGMKISDERVAELEREFYDRPALVNVHFGKQWIADHADHSVFGIGYERHLGAQRFISAGFFAEVLMSRPRRSDDPADFMLGLQINGHPIKPLELSYAIGPLWDDGHLKLFNRFGLGYRVMTMHFAPVPTLWVDIVDRRPRWLLGCQLEF